LEFVKVSSDKIEEEPDTVPGWGSWGGEGIRERVKRKNSKLPEPAPKKARVGDVVINDNVPLKLGNLMLEKAPFPFKNSEQYERGLDQPIGSEWNSMNVFTKRIKPREVTVAGTEIMPLSKDSNIGRKL